MIFQFSDGQTVSQYTAEIDVNESDEEILSVDGRQYYKGFPLDKIVIDEKKFVIDMKMNIKTQSIVSELNTV